MRTWITGANYVSPEGIVPDTDLLIEDGVVEYIGQPLPSAVDAQRIVDATGQYLCPGFVDIHVHGGGGADFADGTVEAFETAAKAHLRHGTTAMMPTLVACDPSEMDGIMAAYEAAAKLPSPMPRLLGVHIEGPYLAPEMAGALDPKYLHPPEPAEYTPWLSRWPSLRRMTVAPELPGAYALIDALLSSGRMVSLGHSAATYQQAFPAFERGAKLATHLFSTMSTIRRESGFRIPGLIETCLVLDDLVCEVIADGCHLPPELLRLIVKAKRQEDIVLVTDAMRAAGQDVEESILGSLAKGQRVVIEQGVAKMPDRMSFAGSIATCDRLLRTMVNQAGVPLHRAVAQLTLNPARALGREDLGRLYAEGPADLVLLDGALNVTAAYAGGIRHA